MPTFIAHIAIDLYKLFKDCTTAADTLCREPSRVMEVTVDVPFMFIVGVLGAKKCWTYGTCEMFYMKLFAWKRGLRIDEQNNA